MSDHENMKKDPYKNLAKWYDRLFGSFNQGLRSLGMRMFPPIEGMAVLDVGCGTGIHLEMYQKAGCDVFGIDMSPGMLHVACSRLGDRAVICVGDASNMPYQDNKFDLIMMTLVLHEMPSDIRPAVIDELKRTLKANGRILLIDYHPGKLRSLKGWLFKVIITLVEMAAGGEHTKNYRDFIANKGLTQLISHHELSLEKERIVTGGNIALYVVRL